MRPHLIQKRKEHNMTQEEVATFLDVTTRHYQALESGDISLPSASIKRARSPGSGTRTLNHSESSPGKVSPRRTPSPHALNFSRNPAGPRTSKIGRAHV